MVFSDFNDFVNMFVSVCLSVKKKAVLHVDFVVSLLNLTFLKFALFNPIMQWHFYCY